MKEAALRARDEMLGALALLTRLPVPAHTARPENCVWAYPLAGLLVGAIGASAFHAGLAPLAGSLLSLGMMALATGGLHEDGLADTFDALGGGRTTARRLEILRDSRIGALGALGLILVLGLRAAALSAMPAPGAIWAIIGAATLARGAMLAMLAFAPAARAEGLAAPLAATPPRLIARGMIVALAIFLASVPRHALASLFACAVTCAVMIRIARTRFGGYTGDLLGATAMLTECAVLLAIARAQAGFFFF